MGKKYRLADETLRELFKQNAGRIIKQTSDHVRRRCEAIDPSRWDEILRSPVSRYPGLTDDPWSQWAHETTDIGGVLHNDFSRRPGS